MDFEVKKQALKKELGEKQNLIDRSQKVISECATRQIEIRGELKIIKEIQDEGTQK